MFTRHISGDRERELFVEKSEGFVPGLEQIVNREIIYSDVLQMYQAGDGGAVFNEYPLIITYNDENAVDDGCVQRDMFSAL